MAYSDLHGSSRLNLSQMLSLYVLLVSRLADHSLQNLSFKHWNSIAKGHTFCTFQNLVLFRRSRSLGAAPRVVIRGSAGSVLFPLLSLLRKNYSPVVNLTIHSNCGERTEGRGAEFRNDSLLHRTLPVPTCSGCIYLFRVLQRHNVQLSFACYITWLE